MELPRRAGLNGLRVSLDLLVDLGSGICLFLGKTRTTPPTVLGIASAVLVRGLRSRTRPSFNRSGSGSLR
jgi:hypothetical protein